MPFARPTPAEWPERLKTVLHVLYLVFNEGYVSSSGPELQRSDLANEAIRLVREVHDEAPRVEETDWQEIFALYGVLEN